MRGRVSELNRRDTEEKVVNLWYELEQIGLDADLEQVRRRVTLALCGFVDNGEIENLVRSICKYQ